jgi:hypothetical protein
MRPGSITRGASTSVLSASLFRRAATTLLIIIYYFDRLAPTFGLVKAHRLSTRLRYAILLLML